MYDHDITLMKKNCDTAKESGLTAVICSDLSAIQYARSIGLEVHMSTQTNISNFEAVKFFSQFADVIVLARELTLKQIRSICKQIRDEDLRGPKGELIEIEIFVHGALCVAISGKCYMSLATYNSSANRGACLQNCRRTYRVTDEETGDELVIDNKYIMSPKDLCTINILDQILDSGVSVLKIEGRGRAPEYVDTVVTCYKEAIDSYSDGTFTEEKVKDWTSRLEKVYNRGFWMGGYYLGKELGEWSGKYGSQAKEEKHYIGLADHYYSIPKVGCFKIEAGSISIGDSILIIGPTTGVVRETVSSIYLDKSPVDTAEKGSYVTIPVKEKIRKGDRLFLVKESCQQ